MKKILILLFITLSITNLSASGFNDYLDISGGYAFRTNAYSTPLPQNGDTNWLNGKVENPFLARHDVSINIRNNMFFSNESRTGLSISIGIGFPLKATAITPTGDFNTDNWVYIESDALKTQKLLQSISLGPVFKVRLDIVDIGMAIRTGLSTTDAYKSFILDIQAEPFLNVFLSDSLYVSGSLTFTGHLMRFIEDDKKIYDENYSMVDINPHIGIGIWIN